MGREAARPAQQAEAGDLTELVVQGECRRAGEVLAGEDGGLGHGVHHPLLAPGGGDHEGV
jgi:hypothetical protein